MLSHTTLEKPTGMKAELLFCSGEKECTVLCLLETAGYTLGTDCQLDFTIVWEILSDIIHPFTNCLKYCKLYRKMDDMNRFKVI